MFKKGDLVKDGTEGELAVILERGVEPGGRPFVRFRWLTGVFAGHSYRCDSPSTLFKLSIPADNLLT